MFFVRFLCFLLTQEIVIRTNADKSDYVKFYKEKYIISKSQSSLSLKEDCTRNDADFFYEDAKSLIGERNLAAKYPTVTTDSLISLSIMSSRYSYKFNRIVRDIAENHSLDDLHGEINKYRIFYNSLLAATKGVHRNYSNTYLYRGYSDPLKCSFDKGYFNHFASTSSNLETAKEFAEKCGCVLRLTCEYAVDMEEFTFNPNEEEVLVPPDSLCTIVPGNEFCEMENK